MIRLIITDFDGTLVDTFEANYHAYEQAFDAVGLSLTREKYRECFGFRFDRFMATMGITDAETAAAIRHLKGEYYPRYFHLLKPNTPLLEFIRMVHRNGCNTAVASTARRKNLENALHHIGATDDFDLILAGENVSNGKPNPEIYLTIMQHFQVDPQATLIFEDSPVGVEAAEASGAQIIRIWNLK